MFKKRWFLVFMVLSLLLVLLPACGGNDEEETAIPTEEPTAIPTSPQTGSVTNEPNLTSSPTPTLKPLAKLVAVIRDIRPNPAQVNEEVTFEGSGDKGEVKGYRWSIQGHGVIAFKESFTSSVVTKTPGSYVITLEVQDAEGLWSPKAEQVLTILPIPLKPDFTCASQYGKIPFTANFYGAAFGDVTAWKWDFGDGSSIDQQNPIHTYVNGGIYTVSLTTSDSSGYSETETKQDFISAIELDFVASALKEYAPAEIKFTNLSKGITSGWKWDFGDGQSSSDKNPTHIYNNPGLYLVTLKVTAPNGEEFPILKSTYIEVMIHNPNANFSYDTPVRLYMPVQFTDLSTGDINNWLWIFGDGGTSYDRNPSHVYVSRGTYLVTLVTSGPRGDDSRQISITVED